MANQVTIFKNVCKGCGLCVITCPKQILSIDHSAVNPKGYHPSHATNPAECIACGMCAVICPDSAIQVEKDDAEHKKGA